MGGRSCWFRKIGIGAAAVFLGLVLIMAGCSSGSSSDTAGNAAPNSYIANESTLGFVDTGAGADDERDDAANAAAPESGGGSEAGIIGGRDAAGWGIDEANPAINRKLIYKAYVTIEVEDFGEARSKIRSLVQLAGGYQLNFNEINSEHDRSGHFTIKVPASGFMDLLNRLEELSPDHYESKVTGQDVTEEYVDLEARLKVLEVTEQRLLSFMEQAASTGDLVIFSQELNDVQQDIERIKGRMRYLEQNVAYSTIELTIYEKNDNLTAKQEKQQEPSFGERLSSALQSVLSGISSVLQELVIFIVAAIPVLLVLALLASPFFFWFRYKLKREREERLERHPDMRRHDRDVFKQAYKDEDEAPEEAADREIMQGGETDDGTIDDRAANVGKDGEVNEDGEKDEPDENHGEDSEPKVKK